MISLLILSFNFMGISLERLLASKKRQLNDRLDECTDQLDKAESFGEVKTAKKIRDRILDLGRRWRVIDVIQENSDLCDDSESRFSSS